MKIEHLEKYSKRALIRAYLCAHSEGQSGCPAGGAVRPYRKTAGRA